MFGPHFDERRGTLLGVRWFHYLWLPIVLHLEVGQAAWACYHTTIWIAAMWRSAWSFNIFASLVPTLFTMGFCGSLYLMATGMGRAYSILAHIEERPSLRERFSGVMKFGIGMPVLGALLQALIILMEMGLAKLVNKS